MKPSIRSITLRLEKETPTKMINYVIFDMDGTLLNTEKLFRRAWIETSDDYGLPNGEAFYELVSGSPAKSLESRFYQTYGNSIDYDEFLNARKRCFLSYIERDVPVKPHAIELLSYLKEQKIKIALATSTNMDIVERNLRLTGMERYFDAVVTGDMVERGKPNPDIFLLAAERIGAKLSEAVVVEDSYNGLRGAHAAGIRGIMIIDSQPPSEETHRITVAECRDLNEVLNYIKTHKGDEEK